MSYKTDKITQSDPGYTSTRYNYLITYAAILWKHNVTLIYLYPYPVFLGAKGNISNHSREGIEMYIPCHGGFSSPWKRL